MVQGVEDVDEVEGTVVGQLAGALWGLGGDAGIPMAWVEKLALRPTIEQFARRLHAFATDRSATEGEE